MKACIRDERATRDASWPGYPPSSLPNTRCITLCGEHASNVWFYHGADHAVLAPLGSPEVCQRCADKVIVAIGRLAGMSSGPTDAGLMFSLIELTVIASAVDVHRDKILRVLGPSVPAQVPIHKAIIEKIRAYCEANRKDAH